jgi:hypothetical protein
MRAKLFANSSRCAKCRLSQRRRVHPNHLCGNCAKTPSVGAAEAAI